LIKDAYPNEYRFLSSYKSKRYHARSTICNEIECKFGVWKIK
jgi:hypothetical protein